MVCIKSLLLLAFCNFLSLAVSDPSVRAQGKRDVPSQPNRPVRIRSSQLNATCAAPVDIPTKAKIPTPFKIFSEAELTSLIEWLSAPEQGLNLTDANSPELKQTDNYIWLVEPLKPNKTDVLAYLDNQGPVPQSYAHVITVEGGRVDPFVGDYYVSIVMIRPELHC
jgi:primary-amine oxidase